MSKIVDIKQHETFGTIYNVKHTDDPINGINGKHFLNLNELCKFDMERINEEICLGLSKIDTFKVPTVPGKIPPTLKTHNDEVYE